MPDAGRHGTAERHLRRRRSVLRTPAFVDRMELPDDAEGRVAIVSVDHGAPEVATSEQNPPKRGRLFGTGDRLGAAIDSRYTAPVLAVALVVALVVGLLLLKR